MFKHSSPLLEEISDIGVRKIQAFNHQGLQVSTATKHHIQNEQDIVNDPFPSMENETLAIVVSYWSHSR